MGRSLAPIPEENLKRLNRLAGELKGTKNYYKFNVQIDVRHHKNPKRWVFIGHGYPNDYQPASYLRIKDNFYIYQGDYRYNVGTNANLLSVLIGKKGGEPND